MNPRRWGQLEETQTRYQNVYARGTRVKAVKQQPKASGLNVVATTEQSKEAAATENYQEKLKERNDQMEILNNESERLHREVRDLGAAER